MFSECSFPECSFPECSFPECSPNVPRMFPTQVVMRLTKMKPDLAALSVEHMKPADAAAVINAGLLPEHAYKILRFMPPQVGN
eukprot:5730087-Pyramimonas_sp.AAC.1